MFVIKDYTKLPIKVWGGENALYGEQEVLKQAQNLANHPIAQKYICLMPDFHLGYGMPIGGVLATKGGVIPNAVGVDIGCGMIAAKTNFNANALTRDVLQKIRLKIHELVPVGNSSHKEAQDNEYVSLFKTYEPPTAISGEIWWDQKPQQQMGTLGGGNHFIEIQKDAEDTVWIMLHTGSRGVGFAICNRYHQTAKKYMKDFASAIPDDQLSFLPESSPEYKAYLADMQWAMKFAELNREQIFNRVRVAFGESFDPMGIEFSFDTHHNYAQMENWGGENLLIHRKGAVKAQGLVTIPGSMGTSSFIGEGLDNPASFGSCSHGAGRLMSRKKAGAAIDHEKAVKDMEHVVFGVKNGSYDEHPHAYKDIDEVMANQTDLVEAKVQLWPMAVCKG